MLVVCRGENLLSSFVNHDRGAVSVIFASMLLVLAIAIGVCIDFARQTNFESRLQAAADAAALTGARMSGKHSESRDKEIEKFFLSNLGDWTQEVPSINIEHSNGELIIRSSLKMPTTFMRLAGIEQVPINVQAAAQQEAEPADVYLVLDMSSSMGIGASEADRTRLEQLTRPMIEAAGGEWLANNPNGCAFGCHLPASAAHGYGFEPAGKTTNQLAKEAGITLREDVLSEASKSVINTLLSNSSNNSAQVRLGVIGFSNSPIWLSKPTDDPDVAIASLSLFPEDKKIDTALDETMPWVQAQTADESGSKKRVVILVTDGVRGGWYWGSRWAPIDPETCGSIKESGAELFVIETKYEDESGKVDFDFAVKSFFSEITPKLQECASPGKHYLASSPEEIKSAFEDVAKAVKSESLRLTQ